MQFNSNLNEKIQQLVQDEKVTYEELIDNLVRQKIYGQEKIDKLYFKSKKYSFIDLFAGIGGTRLGFERAGGVCVYSNEYNTSAKKTYFANFGDIPGDDIKSVQGKDIPDHDILVGGFPCQPFSIAGVSKKKSLGRPTGFEDKTQGTLFFDVCRILKEKRPKAFMLENVKNLLSHDHGNTFKVISESLQELNYDFYYQISMVRTMSLSIVKESSSSVLTRNVTMKEKSISSSILPRLLQSLNSRISSKRM